MLYYLISWYSIFKLIYFWGDRTNLNQMERSKYDMTNLVMESVVFFQERYTLED